MRRHGCTAIVVLAAASASGCANLPPYREPAPSEATATVDVSRINPGAICVAGKLYGLAARPGGQVVVPTDTRVALHSFLYIADYQVSYSCYPGVSFQPVPGERYLMNLEYDSKACHLEVYRKDDAAPVGLDLVPSVGPPVYCGKRVAPVDVAAPPPAPPSAPPVPPPPAPLSAGGS